MDRDQAQKNASNDVFPDAPALLCIWHVNQCVISKCKNTIGLDYWPSIEAKWRVIIRSSTKEQYATFWKDFETKHLNAKTKKCDKYLRNK